MKNLKNRTLNKKLLTLALLFAILIFPFSSTTLLAQSASVSLTVTPSTIKAGETTTATASISINSPSGIRGVIALNLWMDGTKIKPIIEINLEEVTTLNLVPIEFQVSGTQDHELIVEGKVSVVSGDDFTEVEVSDSARISLIQPSPTPQPATPTPVPATPSPVPTTATTKENNTTSTKDKTSPSESSSTSQKNSTSTATSTTSTTSSTAELNTNYPYTPLNERMVTTVDLDIREEPAINGAFLGVLTKGTKVDVLGLTDNGWYIINHNGQTAYLAGSYLEVAQDESTNTSAHNTSQNTEQSNEDTSSKTTSNNSSKTTKETSTSNSSKSDKSDIDSSSNETAETTGQNKQSSSNQKLSPSTLGKIILILLGVLVILSLIYFFLRKRLK